MLQLVLCAALASGPDVVKVASPGLSNVNADAKVVGFFADHFAQQLQLGGVHVTTQSEIGTLLGFERQRQLMGCSDDGSASCLAELSGALGVALQGYWGGVVARDGRLVLAPHDATTVALVDLDAGRIDALAANPPGTSGDRFSGAVLTMDDQVWLVPTTASGYYAVDLDAGVVSPVVLAGPGSDLGTWGAVREVTATCTPRRTTTRP